MVLTVFIIAVAFGAETELQFRIAVTGSAADCAAVSGLLLDHMDLFGSSLSSSPACPSIGKAGPDIYQKIYEEIK